MGYNSQNARRLIFDIETAPLESASEYLIEPVTAPDNYKDPVKIAAFIEEKKAKRLDKCSLDPDLCRLVAIGVQAEDDEAPRVDHGGRSTEAQMLEWFWDQARDHHLVGFCCGSFDLPVLLRRSLYLGIQTPLIQIDRYRHTDYTDLYTVLSYNGAIDGHTLDFYAKRFGLDAPHDALTGDDIGQAVLKNRWDDIAQHCRCDVLKTVGLAAKCGFFTPVAVGAF